MAKKGSKKMANSWDLWIHGVNVRPERTEGNGLRVKPLGWGAEVTQDPGHNWFHFAIPTPTCIDDSTDVHHRDVWVQLEAFNNTVVKEVHVWVGDNKIIAAPVNKTGKMDHQVGLPNKLVRNKSNKGAGLVVCVGVDFPSGGKILFSSVGARFDAPDA